MYLYDIRELPPEDQSEVMYNDETTGEQVSGIIVGRDYSDPDVAFLYIASLYNDENTKVENGIRYKDIFVFDKEKNIMNIEGKEGGWYRDSFLHMFGKQSGRFTVDVKE